MRNCKPSCWLSCSKWFSGPVAGVLKGQVGFPSGLALCGLSAGSRWFKCGVDKTVNSFFSCFSESLSDHLNWTYRIILHFEIFMRFFLQNNKTVFKTTIHLWVSIACFLVCQRKHPRMLELHQGRDYVSGFTTISLEVSTVPGTVKVFTHICWTISWWLNELMNILKRSCCLLLVP